MLQKKGAGVNPHPFSFLISISILSSWRGVHRQDLGIYIRKQDYELRGKTGKLGVDSGSRQPSALSRESSVKIKTA